MGFFCAIIRRLYNKAGDAMNKDVMKIVFVILGTMIGAGFASGQEMYLFFFSYGIEGMIGILISCSMVGLLIYKTLQILSENEISTYKEFLSILIKNERIGKHFCVKDIINLVINIFILITFFIMVAGFGAYFEQEFGVNSIIGSTILSILCFIIFMTSVKGVVKVNEFLVPILIVFLTIIGIVNLKEINFLELSNYVIRTNNSNYVLSAILYSSYNSILLIPVLLTLKKYIKSKRQIARASIISTFIMILLSIIVYLILVRVDVDITNLEMPAVYVVSNIYYLLRYVYGFIILGSIFTTAISLGTSFLQNTTKNKKSYAQVGIMMCITAVLISKIGFSNLVSLLYPIFGYLGLVQIARIMMLRDKKV